MASTKYTNRILAAQRRRKLRERAIAYLGGECQNAKCRFKGGAAAYDFHHPDPLEKDFTISKKMTSWEKIKPELDKCVLVCANCHRLIHSGELTGFLVDSASCRRWIDDGDDPYDAELDFGAFGDEDVPELVEDELDV